MKRRKLLIWLFLSTGFLFFLLIGCSNNNPDTAVQYLEALNQRDLETAQELVCETRQDDVTMGLTSVDDPDSEGFNFRNISCAGQGDGVMCRFTIEQATQSAETTGVQETRQIVFDYEGGQICGFEEQVAE